MVEFNSIPATARVPGFYAELDPSLAGFFNTANRALIIAQRLTAGTVAAGVPTLIAGEGSEAKTYFGQGSMAAEMVAAFRAGNLSNELWVIPLDDNGAGAAAALDVTLTGPATATGTLNFYIGEKRVQVAVTAADTATDVAAALAAAIVADADLPVTATALAGVVTVTARHKGAVGNDIRLQVNVLGALGGEATPAGLAVAIPDDGYLADGASNPSLATAVSAMGDIEYDYIIMPYTDTASLDALSAELERRWGPTVQIFGVGIVAMTGTASALATAGAARNDRFISGAGLYDAPGPAYLRAARYGARAASALTNHPVRPLHGLELVGAMAPPPASRFTWTERETLLHNRVATLNVDAGGKVRIDRAITFYGTNEVGGADGVFLDITTPATLMRVIRELRAVVEAAFIVRRCILVDDGTPIGAGIPHATPSKIKSVLVAHYDSMMRRGLVENRDDFETLLVVERSAGDPTRIDVRYPPDLANPLIILAARVQFSLQWPRELVQAAA